jgi:hypothetical protein
MLKACKMILILTLFIAPNIVQAGVIRGVVTETPSGNPINGAIVEVADGFWGVLTEPDGHYLLEIPIDSTWIIRVEYSPYCFPVWDTVIISANDTLVRNYSLEQAIPVTLRASFNNPVNASYRTFWIKGSWNNEGIYDSGWSAYHIALNDNGNSPDQIQNDGIFTGRAWLHADSIHTFFWGCYSENYGGEAAKLQDGANFQLSSNNPPIVPMLIVNPSGHDNSWGISVYGNDGALVLDLIRGVNGIPTKWGGVAHLDSGVVYTLRFRVMHSPVASYGFGGVGGDDIVFTPVADGSYDFIINDRDDSFIISLTGTDGAPVGLTAVSNLDGHVLLHWFPPGTIESHEIIIDDGQTVSGRYFDNDNDLMGTKFPTENGITLDSVLVHVLTEGDPFWPWPDNTHDPIAISVFMDDGSGIPEQDPAYYTEATANPGEWIRVGVPHLVTTSNFWVMWNNLQGGGNDAIGLDFDTDYPQRKWARINGAWTLFDDSPGDFMIRVKEFGEIEPGWGSYFVYRDTLPQPFYRQRRITPYIIFSPGEFDDSGEDIYGPLFNGVTYYYQVSAVYDIGGGQFIEVGPSNQAIATPRDHSCHYIPGDINSDSTFNGLDVSFMVTYFKGGARPSYVCDCLPDSNWFVAGDVNGNCGFNGLDVTYSVAYFKGGPLPVPCPDCLPEEILNLGK